MDVLIHERGAYSFGPFRLDPVRRTLTRSGESVVLTARLFDTLLYLVENHDRLVEKTEVERAVWRGRAVEAGNLAKAVSSLRKAMQADEDTETAIITVPGRGYRFGLPVIFEPASFAALSIPRGLAAASEIVSSDGATPEHAAARADRRRRLRIDPRIGTAIGAGAFTLLAAGAIVFGLRSGLVSPPSPIAPPDLSIAVMPFSSLGDDPRGSILSYNVSEDLAGDLRNDIPSVTIDAPEQTAAHAKSPLGEIGRTLGVRYVLKGSLTAAGNEIAVAVWLFDTVTQQQLWHFSHTAVSATQWEMQANIVHGIASALNVALVDTQVARAARERPRNPGALDLFYAARVMGDRADTIDQLTDAQHKLERAIAAEPHFVEALADLGWLLVRKLQGYGDDAARLSDQDEAGRVISEALRLDNTNPMALTAHGWLLSYEGRCAEAVAIFDAVLSADPDRVPALAGRGQCAWLDGNPEQVLADSAAILRLDPHARGVKNTYRRAGIAALFAGHYAAARDYLLKWEAEDVDLPAETDDFSPIESGRLYLIAAYALAGDMPEAQRRYRAFAAVWHHRSVWREITFFRRNQTHMPHFGVVEQALHEAGMPMFCDEHADDGVVATANRLTGSDFTPTPLKIPGGETIDTAALQALLQEPSGPLVVQVGKRRAVLPGSLILTDAQAAYAKPEMETASFAGQLARHAQSGIVLMGTGCAGVQGYNAALNFIRLGYAPVYWYRGGEETWAAHNLPAEDLRPF